ncbi:MAG: hypothetical protein AAGJ32_04580 [Pseudomonadota bacterium]
MLNDRVFRFLVVVLALAAVGSGLVGHAERAASLNAMQVAFLEGRFEDAASAARSHDTADAKAFAARALLAKAMCGDVSPPDATVLQARSLAEASLALQPDHSEGRLQLAIARALQARSLPLRKAMSAGRDARALAAAVLEDEPDNGYAHGFMAVWHIEVFERGGRVGATMMGARLDDAHEHYRRAAILRPGDASIHWQYARALAALDAKQFEPEIEDALNAALNAPIEDNVERVMAARAVALAEVMSLGDHKGASDLAARLL